MDPWRCNGYIRFIGIRKSRLKNDVDLRMLGVVEHVHVWMPQKDLESLTPANLPHWIAELRRGETEVRLMRKRLEALQSSSDRPCPHCGRQVAGRADKVYCTTECRVRAHRGSTIGKPSPGDDLS